MTQTQIGGIIRETRERCNMTRKRLANLASVDVKTLAHIEDGTAEVQTRTLRLVLEALGLRLMVSALDATGETR